VSCEVEFINMKTVRSPPEAETFLAFGRSPEAANLSTFLKFGNAKNHRYLFCLCKNEV